MKIFKTLIFITLIVFSVGLQHCAVPVYSELQSARLAGKGNFEVMPSVSVISFTEGGNSDHTQDHIGLSFIYGIDQKLDLRLRYETVWIDGESFAFSSNYHMIGIGPKFSLIEDRLAMYLPIGTEVSDGDNIIDYLEFHPSLMATFPIVKEHVDFTIAPKYLLRPEEDTDDLIAANFSFCFGNLNKLELRTEYGMLWNPGEKGHYGQFSFGVSYNFGQKQVE